MMIKILIYQISYCHCHQIRFTATRPEIVELLLRFEGLVTC